MFSKTVKEAAALILSEMSGGDKLIIRNTKKEDLVKFHLTWGRKIRILCLLWADNDELMKDANVVHPDSTSTAIMEAAWDEIQKG